MLESIKGVVLEVKKEKGQGVTMDILIYDGVLQKGDDFYVGGLEKPIKSKVRALLRPKPLDEIRDPREKFDSIDEVHAACGIKISAPNLDDVVPGAPIRSSSAALNEIIEEIKKQSKIDFELDEKGL